MTVEDLGYYIKVYRLENGSGRRGDPLVKKGFLRDFSLPITLPDVIEIVARNYGGGKYKLQIIDSKGKYVKSKTFDISGPSKPSPCNCPIRKLMVAGCKNKYHI